MQPNDNPSPSKFEQKMARLREREKRQSITAGRRRSCSYGMGRKCAELKTEDAAYVAGYLDGEGCLGVYRRPAKPRGRPTYSVQIAVCTTDPLILDWLRDVTGCGSVSKPHFGNTSRHRPSYRWSLASEAAVTLASQILPYLHTKREQAELLIETHRAFKRDGDLASLDVAYQQSRELNRKGMGMAQMRQSRSRRGIGLAQQ